MLRDITIGQHFPGHSVLHRCDPRLKLVGVIAYIIVLFLASNPLGQNACAEVTYTNNGDEQASFQGYWDWKVQNPAGVITDPTFTGDDNLSDGELAPGGTVSGSVCFDSAEPGEYRLVYEPTLSFSSDTATWVANI